MLLLLLYLHSLSFVLKHSLSNLNSLSHSPAFKSILRAAHLPYTRASGRHFLNASGYLDRSLVALVTVMLSIEALVVWVV